MARLCEGGDSGCAAVPPVGVRAEVDNQILGARREGVGATPPRGAHQLRGARIVTVKVRTGRAVRERVGALGEVAGERLVSILSPILLLVLWEGAGRFGLLDVRFFPPPTAIAQAFPTLLASGELWDDTLPGALPLVFTGIRLAWGTALILIVVGEIFVSRSGLGYLINNSYQTFQVEKMYAGLIVLSAIGYLSFLLLDELQRWLIPWRG